MKTMPKNSPPNQAFFFSRRRVDGIKIKRKVSFPPPPLLFFVFISMLLLFSLLCGLEAALRSCEINVEYGYLAQILEEDESFWNWYLLGVRTVSRYAPAKQDHRLLAHCVKWGVSRCWNHTIRTRIPQEYGQTRTCRVPRHATCPPRVRNRICSGGTVTVL